MTDVHTKPATAPMAEPVRIRQRDTGAIREIAPDVWLKDGDALRHQGYVRVNANDQPAPDESA